MSDFSNTLLKLIRKTLHTHGESITEYQQRDEWVDKQILKISRLKLYGFCSSPETAKLCNKIMNKYDFMDVLRLVSRFHKATESVLLGYDAKELCAIVLESFCPGLLED